VGKDGTELLLVGLRPHQVLGRCHLLFDFDVFGAFPGMIELNEQVQIT
jgi:hypothetical protein